MQKIWVILQKEWIEIFRNRMVVFTVILMPLTMAIIPLAILYSMSASGDMAVMADGMSGLPSQALAYCSDDLGPGDCMIVFLLSQFMIMFMIVPLSIPSAIAAYSVTGEKVSRTLEPLLATPISTVELLAGKALSAVIPAVVATDAAFGLFLLGTWILAPRRELLLALVDVRWLLAVLLLGPLLALLSVTFSVMVSSRVNDPRVAEQISAVMIVPVLAVFFGQIGGLFILNSELVLVSAVVLLLLDGLMIYLSVQLFQRESILTRWK